MAAEDQITDKKPAKASVGDEIEKWFVEHFHGSIVSRETEVYNHVRRAVDDLKRRLG